MQKPGTILLISFGLIVILVFGFLYFKKASADWTSYSSNNLGINIEYPSEKLLVVREEGHQRIEYTSPKGQNSFLRLGTIIFSQTTDGPGYLSITADEYLSSRIDEWINWLKDFYSNSADVVISKQITIAESSGIIFHINERGSENSSGDQNIAFLKNNIVYRISVRGFSENDFEHMWKSFSFSTK